jgi:hypothetical protein
MPVDVLVIDGNSLAEILVSDHEPVNLCALFICLLLCHRSLELNFSWVDLVMKRVLSELGHIMSSSELSVLRNLGRPILTVPTKCNEGCR